MDTAWTLHGHCMQVGTPDYLAPEILLGTGHGAEVCTRAQSVQLGCTADNWHGAATDGVYYWRRRSIGGLFVDPKPANLEFESAARSRERRRLR